MSTTRRQPFMGRIRRVHMVGIGGIGMSSIAEVLLARGYEVTGSDVKSSDVTRRLETLGAVIFENHAGENVSGAHVVVYSSAVDPEKNPETLEAVRTHIPIINRAVMLAELMRMKFGIGVAGTHGKTTTTSLVGLVVGSGGFDPIVVVGGKVEAFGSNAVAGEGDIIVVEADEYDRTFLRLTPAIGVITTIDAEHLDIYDDLDDIKDAFVQFANSVPFFGAVAICIDEPNVQSILNRIERRVISYGFSRQADIRAEHIASSGLSSSFSVFRDDKDLGRIHLSLPGAHNIRNALAAIAVGLELEIPFEDIAAGIASFSGIHRRFEMLGDSGDVITINDYAHHPTEVRATLQAANDAWPDNRIIAVFQPHLYSRTRDLAEDFGRGFLDADVVVVAGIYGAREEPIAGVSAGLVADAARASGHRHVEYVEERRDIAAHVSSMIEAGDRIVFMGAGDIWRSAVEFADLQRKK
ncbi:MAG: UDP-N-acetylmuramate--L-alanine ligase [Rhodothermales bacterium]|nr:UDP-N-acetylmuramate--L-alanine ligase [Rhodothermales bacterium]